MGFQGLSQTNRQSPSVSPFASSSLQRVVSLPNNTVPDIYYGKLPPGLQTTSVNSEFSESRFGHDFSQIPVQTDAPPIIQTKLAVGAARDRYEQEADRVAVSVVKQISAPQVDASQEEIQRKEALEENEELQMKPEIGYVQRRTSNTQEAIPSDIEGAIRQVRGSGKTLPNPIRTSMEQAFGADFSNVRVHADNRSDRLNRAIAARAFTTGQDIFFGRQEYNLNSHPGQVLLAHELTHVVQQAGGAVQHQSTPQIHPVQPGIIQRVNTLFQNYIENYRTTHGLTKKTQAWKDALAAAEVLDHDDVRTIGPPDTRLTISNKGKKYITDLNKIRVFLNLVGGTQQSVINWGPRKFGSFGTWVKAQLLPGGEQQGSAPTMGFINDWAKLYHRKRADNHPIFVRGHLLHDGLGGPGVDYNLTPLTDGNGEFGANSANLAHRYLVEGSILNFYKNMHGANPTVTEINYEVEADFGDHQRTQQIADLLQIKNDYDAKIANKAKTKGWNRGKVKHSHVETAMGYAKGSKEWDAIEEAIDPATNDKADDVLDLLEANHDLWVLEDTEVPIKIIPTVSYTQYGGNVVPKNLNQPIYNQLPTSLDADYK